MLAVRKKVNLSGEPQTLTWFVQACWDPFPFHIRCLRLCRPIPQHQEKLSFGWAEKKTFKWFMSGCRRERERLREKVSLISLADAAFLQLPLNIDGNHRGFCFSWLCNAMVQTTDRWCWQKHLKLQMSARSFRLDNFLSWAVVNKLFNILHEISAAEMRKLMVEFWLFRVHAELERKEIAKRLSGEGRWIRFSF